MKRNRTQYDPDKLEALAAQARHYAEHMMRTTGSVPATLIADTDQTLCQLFGVLQPKKMYGKDVVGVQRSTFLIGPDGRIARVWRTVLRFFAVDFFSLLILTAYAFSHLLSI